MRLSKLAESIEKKGIKVHFKPLEEFTSAKDQFEFPEDIEYINEQLNNGNDAAWFCASVWLSVNNDSIQSETEYLGGCSYKTFDEFTGTDNDYFDDMLRTCLNNLKERFEEIKKLEIDFNI